MATVLIKAERGTDFYVGWSLEFEAPVWWGSRAEVAEYLAEDANGHALNDPGRRLARADEHGTSAVGGFAYFGRWDDGGFMYEQRGVLPRGRLIDACQFLAAGKEEQVWDLLEQFDEGFPVRRG